MGLPQGMRRSACPPRSTRLQWFVVAWLVGDSLLLTLAALSKKGAGKRTLRIWRCCGLICMSMCCLYFFRNVRLSSAVGARAVVIWGKLLAAPGCICDYFLLVGGLANLSTLRCFVACKSCRVCLADESHSHGASRARLTGHDPHDKTPEIMGLQTGGVIAVTQGIGPKAGDRLAATGLFQLSLCMAWLFSSAIFDVSASILTSR